MPDFSDPVGVLASGHCDDPQACAIVIETLRAENELLLRQLVQVQESFEHYYLDHPPAGANAERTEAVHTSARAAAALALERDARIAAEHQRDALLASVSWRITAPLRWLAGALSPRKGPRR
ncbi:hypothetical protein U5801_22430 [Lamprobacter modestohalophilus]|uniref:hypothetical protein n=1 Tax=Lamprobacter modestohalophilus TaxID=1064514 RepID=UPI002ADEDEE1|nr:hypothetical protein [Lamprobacter modestohalophilus]MEA1052542.1 hypothetical protein [Lamprobacter modestohalophilus]